VEKDWFLFTRNKSSFHKNMKPTEHAYKAGKYGFVKKFNSECEKLHGQVAEFKGWLCRVGETCLDLTAWQHLVNGSKLSSFCSFTILNLTKAEICAVKQFPLLFVTLFHELVRSISLAAKCIYLT